MTGSHRLPTESAQFDQAARFPATANQRMVWRDVMAAPDDPRLNAVFRRRFVGRIGDEAIAAALQSAVDRHEILRTCFRVAADGALWQEVLPHVRFKLDQVDLRNLPHSTRGGEMLRLGAVAARRPFAFTPQGSQAPLFAALLIRVSPEEAYLQLMFHQMVMDGWSLDLVVRELGVLAAAADAQSEADLPHVAMHFGDYARWQADVLESDALDADRAYWRDHLAHLPDFRVPPDRDGPVLGARSEIRSILLPQEVFAPFEALARQTNHTLFTFASAAACTALQRATGAGEIVFGTQIAGREDADSEAIVGPLVNSVVLRVPMRGSGNVLETADTVGARLRDAMTHHLLPFAEVDAMVRAQRPARLPSYRVNLVVQRTYISSATVRDSNYGNFRIESVAAPSVGALWDLSLFMVGREEGWRVSCEYSPDLYDEATIDRLLDDWRDAMQQAVAAAEARTSGSGQSPAPVAVASTSDGRHEPVNPRAAELRKRILALQSEGAGTPVMAINNVSVLFPVAAAIGREHPFYDIQFCPSPVPVALPRRHFRDHARDAVEMIRLARPHGPYILFGLCVMGAVAIEAARILQSEGEQVELVVLNDTYRPGFREKLGLLDRIIRRAQVDLIAARKLLRRARAGEVSARQIAGKALTRLGVSRQASGLSQTDGIATEYDSVANGNRWFIDDVLTPSQAALDFEPYKGRVVIFRNEEMPSGRLFPHDFGWQGFVDGEFEVIMCPGNHDTMFRSEGAAVIGASITRILGEDA